MNIFETKFSLVLILLFLMPFGKVNSQNLEKVDSLKNLFFKSQNDSDRVYQQVAISKEFFQTDLILSLDYGKKALEIAEKSEKTKLISYSLFNLGVVFFQQGLLELAIPYFFRYLEINRASNDEKAIAYALVNIGAIHLQIDQLDKAQEYFEEALTLFVKINAQTGKPAKENISIYNNLGVIAKKLQESEKAINYYKSGIDLARKTPGFDTELGNLLNNLGNIYLLLGKPELSFQHLNEALELRTQKNDMTGLVKSYLALGEYYKFKNLDDEGLGMLYSALELSDKVGILSSKAEAQKHLFELYQKKEDYDSALKYHVQYTELENQINKESALKEIKQLEIAARYKESQKQAEVEMKQKELNYLFIGMIIMLTIFILSSLYYMDYNKTSRLTLEKENMSLNTKNIELENEKLEKELEFKNKQLITGVIYQVKNNEIINNIILKLQNLNGKKSKDQNGWVDEVLKDLKQTQHQTLWAEFEMRFQQVHNDFYNQLNEINSGLSPNERRLCAFLKLNMTTKEISSITGQSARSIEVARTRLRKKLDLTNSDIGLIQFLSKL